ncbi:MAG: hypothetical protein EBR86_03865 [Planctomycetia bacterium]|nr:hypothetical protein [Planctomycetia bacterium]
MSDLSVKPVRTFLLREAAKLSVIAIAFLAGGLWGSDAPAQGMGPARNNPGRRPSVSPYMALAAANAGNIGVNQNGSLTGVASTLAAVNAYSNITRPGMEQQRMQAQQSRLGSQVGRLQSQLRGTKLSAADLASGLLISPTGRAATYGNLSHYYPNKK